MRPRTKIAIPNHPDGSEFENFDRLATILGRAKPPKKKIVAKRKRLAKNKAKA
jgi:hypothetical protein